MITFLTAGESHGPKLTGIIEGLPSGFLIDTELVNVDLARRQQGFGRGGRMKIEKDTIVITSGVAQGITTGAPLAIEIFNKDYKNWQEKDIPPMVCPRPGHADYTGALKYQHPDLRLSLERASARETAMRTAVGSICKQILGVFGIKVLGYTCQIGSLKYIPQKNPLPQDYENIYQKSLKNEFAFPHNDKTEDIRAVINGVMKEKDTLGGAFEVVGLNVPPGLGSYVHYHRKLDGLLAGAMVSIPAMKAVEIGNGIVNASKKGTEVHDEFSLENDKIHRTTNNAGGLEGGVTNGMPLVVRVYMKPISTTLKPLTSIDLSSKKAAPTVYERSDFCAVQRAVVVGEAMMSFVLLNELMKRISGDNKKLMQQNFAHIEKGLASDFHLANKTWRFGYEK